MSEIDNIIDKRYEFLSNFKFYSNYSKYNDYLGRRETWEESVDRVFNEMHEIKFKNVLENNPKFKEYYEFAKDMYKKKYVLASQRSLQFGGEPILKHNSKMFNCLTGYCDRIKFFQETMYWLLSGCGVGFSVQKHHVEKLPNIKKRSNRSKIFVIEDSIEGWSDAIGVLLSSYFDTENVPFPKYQNCHVHFDFSQIRPKGAKISGGFKAPGPDGLRASLLKIEKLLERELNENGFSKVKPIVAYDIVMHMSDAVLSGGVRRSATISLFSKDDHEMINAKTGNWFIENPQRARSNNSVVLNKKTVTREEFSKIMKSVKEFGEPGFIFTDDEEICYNPCVEIGMIPKTEDGISGFQGCNLVEINGGKCNTYKEFLLACKAGAIIGTMQAAYTDFKYVGKETKEIFDREALLGVSITGFMNNPHILLSPEIQREGAELVKLINKEVAEMIGIRQAARTTCVKPSGNASVLLVTASGIHGEHSEFYIRNVQVNKDDEIGKIIAEKNPKMVEESVWSANKTDNVISFPICAKKGSIYKDELYGVKLLENVKLTQQNWVEHGTNEHLSTIKEARHNVSNTVLVDDWDKVEDYIFENRKWFAGISLLPISGDKDYNQAPFLAILTPKQILEKYGEASLFASGLIVDGLNAFNNNLWLACDTVLGYGEKFEYSNEDVENIIKTSSSRKLWVDLGFKNGTVDTLDNLKIKPCVEEYKRYMDSKLVGSHNYALKKDWVRRAKQFAERYFNNNLKNMTYCLKDVNNCHKWIEINREINFFDWDKLNSKPEYVEIDTLGSIACSGGQCEITF